MIYAFFLTLLAGLATGIGSIIAFVAHRTSRGFFSFTRGLSAGVMLYVSFVELFDHPLKRLLLEEKLSNISDF